MAVVVISFVKINAKKFKYLNSSVCGKTGPNGAKRPEYFKFLCPDYFIVFEGMFVLYSGLVLGTDWMDQVSRRQYSSNNTLSTQQTI